MSVLTLAEAKEHLNITVDTYDDELTATIDAAEAIVGRLVGPLTPTSTTARVHGCTRTLLLPSAPALTLTSVTPVESGSPLDVASLLLDTNAGTVVFTDGRTWFWARAYDVEFDTGWAADALPADLLYAVKEMVRHLWKTQRGAMQRPGSGDAPPPPGYLIPNAVAELLDPYIPLGVG